MPILQMTAGDRLAGNIREPMECLPYIGEAPPDLIEPIGKAIAEVPPGRVAATRPIFRQLRRTLHFYACS
jgi:hypothetical protein